MNYYLQVDDLSRNLVKLVRKRNGNNSTSFFSETWKEEADAAAFVSNVFCCLGTYKRNTYNTVDRLDVWEHRNLDTLTLIDDLRSLSIDRNGLISLCAQYIENSLWWCKELDWLFIDLLIYAEFLATNDDIVRQKYSPFLSLYLENKIGTNVSLFRLKSTIVFRFIALFSIILYFTSTYSKIAFYIEAGLILIFSICLSRFILKRLRVVKILTKFLMRKVNRIYKGFATADIDWIISQKLIYTRKREGIVFDEVVFNLVNIRVKKGGGSTSLADIK